MDICFHEGLFYLTTHTTKEDGSPNHGCLSIWDRGGGLVWVQQLGDEYQHPNGLAVYTETM